VRARRWRPRGGLWGHRGFLLLWGAQGVSAVGSRITRTALLSIPAAAFAGLVTLPLLLAIATVTCIATVVFGLADHVYVTDLVGRKRVLDANGKREAVDAIAEISGPALGGALVAWLTAPLAIAVDAATFVVSAALLARIAKRETVALAPAASSFADDVRTGVRAIWRNPAVRALFVATATLSFCMSFMASLYTLFALSHLGLTPTELGITIGCGGIGGLAGAALAETFGMRPTLWVLAVGVAAAALSLVATRSALPASGAR
jgi:Major Facilitator Superfamily